MGEAQVSRLGPRELVARSSGVQVLGAVAVVGAVAALGFSHRADIGVGRQSLSGADGEWLTLAAAAAGALWVVGTITQLGAIPVRLSVRRLLAVQVAASFLNHLLPAGSGGIAVNVRFLQRNGMTRSGALAAVGLNSLAGFVTHLLLVVGSLLVAPSVLASLPDLQAPAWVTPSPTALMTGGAALLTAIATGWWLTRGRVHASVAALGRKVRTEARSLRSVLADPWRAAGLWLGSLCVPLLHAFVLVAVLRAISVSAPVVAVAIIYVVASAAAALLPSPGGVGALDVALVAGLVAIGVTAPYALAAVVAYRLFTVWAPLVPAALVFAVLLRRRII
jgi:uncharacterized membrane protein YbhN (UPF0104 family)